MDKNAIKKYAVWARRELIARVSQKAIQYGITAEDFVESNAESINGTVLTAIEKKQRQALISEIKEKGYEQVMEEVAYTWFNRFSALRFMEVNGYLPSHVRVFTDEDNNFKPQIITEAIHLEMDGLDMEKVYVLKDANKTDELYKYLVITQCNALSSILPGMFQRIEDFSELLFPDNLLRDGSAIQQMIELIPEEDWKDAVQIIGWLYQYYNSEKKDDVFAALKKNVKITKDNIPAATQLFTPDWIVRYMVENSLGRLWLEGHPNDSLKTEWKYYLDEAEQEADVQKQIDEIRKEYAGLKPENIKCIDPCMGSGHILAYMFDVLVQIYEAYGYSSREAVESIVKNNIYGLDIDDRAAQLANFAVMMKARQYDRRFFSRGVYPHVYAIKESNGVHITASERLGDERKIAEKLIHGLHDAKEYGSILNLDVTIDELAQLRKRLEEIDEMSSMGNLLVMMEAGEIIEALVPLIDVAETLVQKYDTVVTNPPYMGASNMNQKLNDFIKGNFPDYKTDFFSAFIVKCSSMAKKTGKLGFLTPYVWMFIQSYEKMRQFLFSSRTVETLIQFEYSAFEEATVPVCTFVFSNSHIDKRGCYLRLTDYKGGMEIQRIKALEAINNHDCGFYFEQSAEKYEAIPGTPVAYWLSDNVFNVFQNSNYSIGTYSCGEGKNVTTNNAKYILFFWEINNKDIGAFDYKWLPCAMGGDYRKWYGNIVNVIDWSEKARTFYRKNQAGRIIREEFWNLPGVTWGKISSASPSFRLLGDKQMYQETAVLQRNIEDSMMVLTIMNTKVSKFFLSFLAPTLNFQLQDICAIPVPKKLNEFDEDIKILGEKCVTYSREEWDSYETSFDFIEHPFVRWAKGLWDCTAIGATMSKYYGDNKPKEVGSQMELCYLLWQGECNERFNQLKANEEELNRIFIDIYGLQDELTPEVEDKDVTVRKADLQRDVKSFISYAVGCMFGRYSLDVEGLAYAGGEWDAEKYRSFPADKDNIIPICDDEYFEDDIVGRFIEFVKVVYGADSLEANLQFVADALGGKGSSREVIRNYFRNDFYNDHCKMYQKRPIYWLFDSGKKGGFKALIYMHRYQQDTIARMRTDYVHEQQARYRTEISDLEARIAGASTSERVKLNKRLVTLQVQADEIHDYEEKIHHLADQMIRIDLDDGVKNNYEIFKDVLAKIK